MGMFINVNIPTYNPNINERIKTFTPLNLKYGLFRFLTYIRYKIIITERNITYKSLLN